MLFRVIIFKFFPAFNNDNLVELELKNPKQHGLQNRCRTVPTSNTNAVLEVSYIDETVIDMYVFFLQTWVRNGWGKCFKIVSTYCYCKYLQHILLNIHSKHHVLQMLFYRYLRCNQCHLCKASHLKVDKKLSVA